MSAFPRSTRTSTINGLFPWCYHQPADIAWNTPAVLDQIKITSYAPRLNSAVGWLPTVQTRIRNSLQPVGCRDAEGPEYISGNSANAALSFFDIAADLLPGEPHLYASQSGDLVAEFQTDTLNLTAVISYQEVLLFLVKSGFESSPQQQVIPRSEEMRKQVRAFAKKNDLHPHGSLAASR